MAVKPETAVHRVDHSIEAFFEFSKLRLPAFWFWLHLLLRIYMQVTTPETVAGATADAFPMNIAQKCG